MRPARVDAPIDLRSDTVTHPTDAMRAAMARAEVGDDSAGEDPTINRLEELAAERLGKEAALYVASGRMGNLVAVLTHTRPGDELVCDEEAHVSVIEGAALAALAGVVCRTVPTSDGMLTRAHVEAVAHRPAVYALPPRLLVLENTHNFAGGTVMTGEQTAEVAAAAREHGLRVHLDGARLFNAAAALAVDARVLARPADSVMVTLSKGLSAPVGSVLAGDRDFILRARHFRRLVGGAMRQSGVIAAAGIVALETMVARLAEDHRTARRLAEGLQDLPGVTLDLARVQTNIVMVEVFDAPRRAAALAARGVLAHAIDDRRLRFVTHRHIAARHIDEAIEIMRDVLGATEGRIS